jgi:hypothetical protein
MGGREGAWPEAGGRSAWLTVIRFGCDMAGEIVHIVERQVNDESRSERLYGLETSGKPRPLGAISFWSREV